MYSARERSRIRLAALGLLAGLAACSQGEPTRPDLAPTEPTGPQVEAEHRSVARPSLSQVYNSAPALALCGPEVKYRLWAGRYFPGTVSVSNDAQNLYVTYAVQGEEWFITDTRLSVTRTVATIPVDSRKLPNPWAFPFSGVHQPAVKAFTYSVPLAKIGVRGGDPVVVAAMAGVVHPKTSDWSGEWEWISGWGIGNVSGTKIENVTNYRVAACPNAPPPPPPSPAGAITITFDDGWLDTYTNAFPVLQQAGIRANVAVNPTPVDEQWVGYMNLTQLRALHNAGWAVVSHSMTHRDLVTLSEAELLREVRDSRAWIERNGFRGSHVFVVPFHSWGARERALIQQHYRAARGYSVNQFTPGRMVKWPIASPFDLTGYEPEFAPFTTADGREITRDYLERAVKEGEFVDIFFHNIRETDVAAFRELVEILAEFEPYIKTYDEIIPR